MFFPLGSHLHSSPKIGQRLLPSADVHYQSSPCLIFIDCLIISLPPTLPKCCDHVYFEYGCDLMQGLPQRELSENETVLSGKQNTGME